MRLSISISEQAEAKIRERAATEGQSPEAVASRLVEEGLQRRSLDEILAPVRAEFEATGMTDEALGELLDRAKHEMRDQRRNRRAS